MEAKELIAIFFTLSAVLGTGCASATKSERASSNSNQSAPKTDAEFYGPPGPSQIAVVTPVSTPEPQYGPQLPQLKRIVIVIGPGMARAFAAAGFLKVLEENKIPIGAIVGTEMGALVAALYVFSKSKNDFEWSLTKFKPDFFSKKDNFSFSRLIGKGRATTEIEKAVAQALQLKQIEDSRILLRIGIYSESARRPLVVERGSATQAVVGALASDYTYESVQFEMQTVRSCPFECGFLVQEAKRLGLGPVVVIDAVTEKPTRFESKDSEYFSKVIKSAREFQEQLGAADLVVRPEVQDISYFDFTRKSAAAFAGAKAARGVMAKLQEMVAVPVELKQ